MSNLQQQKATGANATTAASDGSNIFYQAQKLGGVSSPLPTPLPLLEQMLVFSFSLPKSLYLKIRHCDEKVGLKSIFDQIVKPKPK